MRKVAYALVFAALALVTGACGSNSNEDVIGQAKDAEAAQEEIYTALDEALHLHHYAGVDESFTVPSGRCDIVNIVVGDGASIYENDSATLFSPDGDAAVKVGGFQGVDKSECLTAANDALGW